MFFDELFLVIILCFFCTFMYSFLSYYLVDKTYQDLFFTGLMGFMTILFLMYCHSDRMLVFLDIPIFLGYLNKHEKDSLFLSLVLTTMFIVTFNNCSLMYFLKYVCFYIGFRIVGYNKKLLFDVLIGIKSFFFTYVSLSYFGAEGVSIFCLVIFVLFFYVLTFLSASFLKLRNNDYSQEKKAREKIIFRIIHEIKNPIAVCKGYLSMLDLEDTDTSSKYINVVESEMSRALTIMDDFISIGSIKVNSDILDIYTLLDDIKLTMDSFLKNRNIELIIPKCDDEFFIMGDYDRLKQVFLNLVKNSYEANATKIEIIVSTFVKRIKITVIDNGDGIDKETLKRIGEIFYTTKHGGSGLGVNLSREIISLHDGEIKYTSSCNNTKAMVFLPIEKGIN